MSMCATRTAASSMELDHYREVVERIRASDVDMVINPTTGPGQRYAPSDADPAVAGPGTTLMRPEPRGGISRRYVLKFAASISTPCIPARRS